MAFPLLIPALSVVLKALLVKLVMAVLTYALYKLLMVFGSTIIDWAMAQITSGVNLSDTTIQLTGMAAWLADQLMLGQCISLLISFCVIRFTINLVRG